MASLQHVSLGSVQQCDSVRWAAPKKKFELAACVRVLERSEGSYAPPHAVALSHRRRTTQIIYNTTLLHSPQKPIIPQLHDHGHLAVELDALEGHARAMALQGVVAPPGRGLLQSVGDRRPVVLVLELFC